MKKRIELVKILRGGHEGQRVTVMGWVRSFRNNQFVALNDGSCLGTLQVVVNPEKDDADVLKRLSVGAAVCFEGNIVESQGKGQKFEMISEKIEIFGDCDASVYPLQPKKHSLEFLFAPHHPKMAEKGFGQPHKTEGSAD